MRKEGKISILKVYHSVLLIASAQSIFLPSYLTDEIDQNSTRFVGEVSRRAKWIFLTENSVPDHIPEEVTCVKTGKRKNFPCPPLGNDMLKRLLIFLTET